MSASILARPLAARVHALPELAAWHGETTEPVHEGVLHAAFKALDDGQTHYTDRPGIKPLRTKAVTQLGMRYGVEYTADEVTITCGATEARFVALKQLVDAGKKILHAGDDETILGAAALIGAALTTDPDDADIALLYLTNTIPAEQAQALAERAGERGWWILFDTATPDHNNRFHPALSAELAPLTITIGSASDQLPGWRVGWLAGSKVANKLRAYKQSMTICTPSVSQWAAMGLEETVNGAG